MKTEYLEVITELIETSLKDIRKATIVSDLILSFGFFCYFLVDMWEAQWLNILLIAVGLICIFFHRNFTCYIYKKKKNTNLLFIRKVLL